MKISIEQARVIMQSAIFGEKLPAATSFRFARLGKTLVQEMETFNAERVKLIDRCGGVLNEDGTQYTFSPENAPTFQDGFKSLVSVEIDIGDAFPIPVKDLGEASFSPNDLALIEPLLALP